MKLEDALRPISGDHLVALNWFNEHAGQRLAWVDIQKFSSDHSRLVNQAKGIYKPHYTDYALSVRTIQDGPYPDREVEIRDDGSWVTQYFQENPEIDLRDKEATNRGLVRCMEDNIPIGFLIKRKRKPGVEYDVLGLGMVVSWDAGYFTIEGFSARGHARIGIGAIDAAISRAQNSNSHVSQDDFLADSFEDLRAKSIAVVARRRGQASFRASLLEVYDGKCCVTGCDLKDVLEAAHITPYLGDQSNHIQNGLLLRTDIHTLYDLGLVAINADNEVVLAPKVASSPHYQALLGLKISLPARLQDHPSKQALQIHYDWAGIPKLID